MGGEGSINHMIKTLKFNKGLLGKNSRFSKSDSFFDAKTEYKKYRSELKDHKSATPEQLKAIRKKVQQQQIKHYALIWGIGLTFSVCTAWLIYYVWNKDVLNYDYYPAVKTEKSDSKSIDQRELENKLNFYLTDGDLWLRKHHWGNAYFQYQKALEMDPHRKVTNIKLAIYYQYQCMYTTKNCEYGLSFMDSLIQEFPDNNQLKRLRKLQLKELDSLENAITLPAP